MEDKKKLTETQFQLLAIKEMELAKASQDFRQTLNMIGKERGIENLTEWELSEDRRYLTKIDKNKQEKT